MNLSRNAGSLLLVLASLVAQFSPGCSPGQGAEAKKAEEPGKPVRVELVGRINMDEVLTYVADLVPYTEVKVYSPVPDRILYFPWKNGDEIKAGQQVALIRKEGLDKGLEQIAAQLEVIDVQIQNLKSDLDRSKGLLKAGAITQAVYDRTEAQYLAALGQKRSLEAGRGQLAATASNAILTAPITGVVANKMLEQGDIASPQFPLCRIMAIDRLKANLRLIETDVHKVRLGQEVVLRMDCCPDRTFTGKITRIYPYLERETRTNTVEVTVDNPVDDKAGGRLLKPGMYGTAEITVSRRDNVVAVPEPALLLDNELLEKQKSGERLRRAFVVEGNTARARLVRLGARNGTRYEVLEGLAEGERVVVRGQHQLKDGQKVEIVEAR
ncbi:MAG: efflux RND transporter periplasmic adaptor subunit [Myxococcales bacterium]|nr:efflux RND transporter periplasmic adaptor subunit [Myxococcales bacterium]